MPGWTSSWFFTAASTLLGMGCFSEPPDSAASSGSGAAESSSSTSDDRMTTTDETAADSSSGEFESSSSSGFFDEAVYVYATDTAFKGNFVEQAANNSLVDFVDGECVGATASVTLGCSDAAAVLLLPGFSILDALPEGEYLSASGELIAGSRDDFFLGTHALSLTVAGAFPLENPKFWTGAGNDGQDCMNWSVDEGSLGSSGDAASTGAGWLSESLTSCGSELRLLCVCVIE